MSRRNRAKRSLLWRFRRVWFAMVLLGIAAVSGAGYVLAQVPLPDAEVPVETTLVYDAQGRKLAELYGGENRVSVTLDQVSDDLVHAVLAAEDQDFFRHPGVDVSAIARALIADARGQPLQGGSTITQQYVKQAFVGSERSLTRKAKEASLALKLERKFSKEEILERYLNIVYFGRGAHGVQAASHAYFGKDVSEIQPGEAALLAGLIRSPEVADPSRAPKEAVDRRNHVLDNMVKAGWLSQKEHDFWYRVPIEWMTRPRDEITRDKYVGAEFGTQHAVEHVRRQLQHLGFSDAQINGGGLRVHTSLDLDLQAAAFKAVYVDTLNQPDDPDGALISIDTEGYIKAMVGGRSWDAEAPWARVNFALGALGGGSGRQAGSSFKPYALAATIVDGYSLDSVFPAPSTVVFPGRNGDGSDYTVSNYEEAAFGSLTILGAIAKSSNTVFAQVADAIGPERVADMAKRLGVSAPVKPFLSIALGTNEISPLDQAVGFMSFATRGLRVEPAIVVRVTDLNGRELYTRQPTTTRVLDEDDADMVNYALQTVVTGGTGTRARLDTPVAGKTGTSQGNGDAWFVGYTPGLSTAVWMGYPEGQKRGMLHVHGIRVTGGSLPAMAWKRYMDVAVTRGEYRGDFVPPKDVHRGTILKSKLHPVLPEEPVDETTTTTAAGAGSTTTTAAVGTTTTKPPGGPTTSTKPPGGPTTSSTAAGATTSTTKPG
jgi:penicillin-binding protein 1A